MSNLTDEELLACGRRVAYKNQCKSVIVAPDHTGENNYHICSGSPHHKGKHDSNMYEWDENGYTARHESYLCKGMCKDHRAQQGKEG